ncbi:hypothetical protein Y032_0031g2398 [Ancylostoma ceylanicum]|uniref:Uncharacterized protein n=1 Tax=Ancylostoma ceylanicum TaxID=53326 RepID=A0A016UQ39_9BILA|nr:hypothetical protein Y032_0031g2398 [Ancylostoma ceylanicum]
MERHNLFWEKYSELQAAVDRKRGCGSSTLVICCPSRSSGKARRIGFPPCLCPAGPLLRCSRQTECPRRGLAPCLWSSL